MVSRTIAPLLFFSLLFISINPSLVLSLNPNDALKTYVISVQPPEFITTTEDLESWYGSFLPTTADGDSAEPRMVHSYTDVFSGFAARLTDEEVEAMKTKEGFVRAFPDRHLDLHTTHTPDFLGLRLGSGTWKTSSLGQGVVIGMLDTGVDPTHPSFSDDGMSPPPLKWKGTCNFKTGCNKKLVGAKSFASPADPPLDKYDGHGTHTASTSGGNFVSGAELFGLANGTATGMAPRAHLAIYQVCSVLGCNESDVLAAMDAAVKDGVDVLSLSLGGPEVPFDQDLLAIGAFGAASKGITVVCSAGNGGPDSKSLSNTAPWILTVGASTVDRSLRSTVTLGDGQEIYGETLFQPRNSTGTGSKLPIFYADNGDCSNLDGANVKGKVVVCMYVAGGSKVLGELVRDAGGAGLIVINSPVAAYTILDTTSVIPTATVSFDDGSKIVSYIESAGQAAAASITFGGTVLGVSPAPAIAFFSSRGPSRATTGIIKPDIIGPGVNILAAWPPIASATNKFNIISGTSMSCPHLSGVAGLVKAAHPDWSPAAIKSAIMTTSYDRYPNGDPIVEEHHQPTSPFDLGAGHVDASKVTDPGLVYDLTEDDYIPYLCGLLGQVGTTTVTRRSDISCSKAGNISEEQLNYPTILLPAVSEYDIIKVNRTVTNVGEANSVYKVELDVPEGFVISVVPNTLSFTSVKEKKSFIFSVTWGKPGTLPDPGLKGDLRWVSKNHVVRSPIVFGTPYFLADAF